MASLRDGLVKLLALGMMATLPGLMAACAHAPQPSFTELVTEDFSVPAVDAGVQLHVRNKRPAALSRFAPDNVVLFVHGATGSPETGFDLALDGLAWIGA